ncbi:hypothetical protein C1645_743202 [Glomus cerebriforme]|uniref:Uncharacterized protein n=1 Tax=Glomus cerebriforme TaxID=658196 RepID=A0A397SEW7_9GLOM|nr:hypothetical protein C1645_743202 [Glomus cerebriforme]
MVNAQEWLDQHYPKEGRNEIKELDISHKNLEGDLDLNDFIKLEKEKLDKYFSKENSKVIILGGINQEFESEKMIIDNYSVLEEIMTNGEVRNIIEISIINCPQLKKIDISNFVDNKKLEINNCPNLREFNCENNQLTNMNFRGLENLTHFNLNNNNFSEQDLTIFSRFINLKELCIGNDDDKKIKNGIYNRFRGSLEPLKSLTKLEKLNINNTDLNSGVEHLPVSLSGAIEKYKNAKILTLIEEIQHSHHLGIISDDEYKRQELENRNILNFQFLS